MAVLAAMAPPAFIMYCSCGSVAVSRGEVTTATREVEAATGEVTKAFFPNSFSL